jgi:hypothetical protein
MFAKIFAQIFDSTIADNWQHRHVFMDLLVMADAKGNVAKTPRAIARITGVPLEIIEEAIDALSQPDADSGSPEEDGRRLVLICPERRWGWRIVNYEKYRRIRDEEARREYFKEYRREERASAKPARNGHKVRKAPKREPRVDLRFPHPPPEREEKSESF